MILGDGDNEDLASLLQLKGESEKDLADKGENPDADHHQPARQCHHGYRGGGDGDHDHQSDEDGDNGNDRNTIN